ncbi:MAG: hypothetical protein MPK07_01090 [Alphaproteobacteria bacterium]|nr:hypothetical protein [Alphaproteobacteria bacterium]MDA8001341.1 hypothetical protein [Alphaproteobacteria bacterium]MDA8012514.1 hypothetical protein [Alphaproteobacteria bacterium]
MSKSALIATLLAPFVKRNAPPPRPPERILSDEEWQEWRQAREKQVRSNGKIFREKFLAGLIADGHKWKTALMRDGEIVEILDTFSAATARGRELFPDEVFSVQTITDEPLNMGTLGAWLVTRDEDEPVST